jgi:hypothetical protein
MSWTRDDLVSGERLQSLAEVTVLTASIAEFHRSLPHAGVGEIVCFPGTHTQLQPDPRSIQRLQGYRSIFVYTHQVHSFLTRVLPRLSHSFVLLTHNSDDAIGPAYRPALADPRLHHWFAQNAVMRHPKLTPLPIGIANAQWPHGDLDALLEASNQRRDTRRDVVYVNFDVRTNPAVRIPLRDALARSPHVWLAPPRPFRAYLDDMAACHWVLSPPGNGVDCHRTWEALYLGCVPIVARTEYGTPLHDGFPIVQVEDISRLNARELETSNAASELARASALERLKMSYWRALISEYVRAAG